MNLGERCTLNRRQQLESNDELAGFLSRLYTSLNTGDASIARTLVSKEPGILGIGTDPYEWWWGDMFARALSAQIPEMFDAGMRFQQGNIQAHSEGSVGWTADQPTLKLPHGEVPMRLTAVWHQEEGSWKIVQFHLSVGVPNQEMLGQELTR
jgi:hypothetical protein